MQKKKKKNQSDDFEKREEIKVVDFQGLQLKLKKKRGGERNGDEEKRFETYRMK